MTYARIAEQLRRREVVILDGGTGTELQQRGVPMNGDTWCADATLTHPDVLRDVHRAYVEAGAEVITANTFATSPLLFRHLNRDADVARIDARAVQLAREAVIGTPVCVAGSMSTMRPMLAGTDRNNLQLSMDEAQARALFQRKAQGLKEFGCDLIQMEMLRDTDYAVWACAEALSTGLPVWVGVSAERGSHGGLQGWGREDCSFESIVRALAALRPEVMMVMHTSPNDTADAIAIVRAHWGGPIAVYPECGYFKSPDWEFVDVMAPAELVRQSEHWRTQGAALLGGCCGIGPEHIAALRQAYRRA